MAVFILNHGVVIDRPEIPHDFIGLCWGVFTNLAKTKFNHVFGDFFKRFVLPVAYVGFKGLAVILNSAWLEIYASFDIVF